MNCSKLRLEAFAAHALPEEIRRLHEEHLGSCADCTQKLSAIHQFDEILRDHDPARLLPAESLAASIRTRLAEDIRPSARPLWVRLAAGSAFATLAVCGFIAGKHLTDDARALNQRTAEEMVVNETDLLPASLALSIEAPAEGAKL
jgi:hypothetical protein